MPGRNFKEFSKKLLKAFLTEFLKYPLFFLLKDSPEEFLKKYLKDVLQEPMESFLNLSRISRQISELIPLRN